MQSSRTMRRVLRLLSGSDGQPEQLPPGIAYRAFISYRSTDRVWAKRLHRRLERYRVPRKLVGTVGRLGDVPGHLRPIFRDRDDARPATDLEEVIAEELGRSLQLIVLCTPAAASDLSWVGREIEIFRERHPSSPIHAVIAEGNPPACFPRQLLTSTGSGHLAQPLAADFRSPRHGGDGWNRGFIKIAAAVLGTDFDRLWQRERRRRLRRLVGISAAVAALVVSVYGFLFSSYYISTTPSADPIGSAQLVVRTGHPYLKLMPGFDRAVVLTDHSLRDLAADDQASHDAFTRELISDKWYSRPNGYTSWADQITRALAYPQSAEALRLLQRLEAARDLLLSAISNNPADELRYAHSLGALGRANPEAITTSFLGPLLDLTTITTINADSARLIANAALAEMAADGAPVSRSMLLPVKIQLQLIPENRAFGDELVQTRRRRALLFESIALVAQADPDSIESTDIALAYDIFRRAPFELNTRGMFLTLAAANHKAAAYCFEELIRRIVTMSVRPQGSGYPEAGWLLELAGSYPEIITTESLTPLVSHFATGDYRMAVVYAYLLKLRPFVADDDVVRKFRAALSNRHTLQRASHAELLAIALTIVDARKGADATWASLLQLEELLALPITPLTNRQFRWEAASAALQLLSDMEPSARRNHKLNALTDRVIELFGDLGTDTAAAQLNTASFLARAIGLSRDAVTASGMRTLVQRAPDGIDALLGVARHNPSLILKNEHALFAAEKKPGDDRNEYQHLATATVAAARYGELVEERRPTAIETLMLDLGATSNRRRLEGAFGLFLLTLDEPDTNADVIRQLNRLAGSPEPHIRMAANRTREMLRLSRMVAAATQNRRLASITKTRLKRMADDASVHIRVAVRFAVTELSIRTR